MPLMLVPFAVQAGISHIVSARMRSERQQAHHINNPPRRPPVGTPNAGLLMLPAPRLLKNGVPALGGGYGGIAGPQAGGRNTIERGWRRVSPPCMSLASVRGFSSGFVRLSRLAR